MFNQARIDCVLGLYEDRLRSNQLGDQPAPWIVAGLQALEKSEKLTPAILDKADNSGGTDHPDPFV